MSSIVCRWGRMLHFLAFTSAPLLAATMELPPRDLRATPPRTLNTLRAFPQIASQAVWQARAQAIREHILVSCGLWPMPEKTPLKAEVFGRIERDGYTVENVYLQTYPGFYLAGNLYRPSGKGNGPFPGILNPHGHWSKGRLEDLERGSIPARCINFARQGMVAFAYDMVGYNDTAQVNHKFGSDPANLLWNISLMGLQTWNSIRALDFLESLPDVDPKRLACTGASGGGTQTFMLGAIDNRLAAQAPNVMVSHSMQGGCLCENAPGLRVKYSNMEIAAAAAPRPQLLVAASGDWTKETMTVEGPAVQRVYRLFGAEDHLRFVRFDFEHNYNQTSREEVYGWFNRWLLNPSQRGPVMELSYTKEPDEKLRVWPDKRLPEDALDEAQLTQMLIAQAREQLDALKPVNLPSLESCRQVLRPLWQHSLQLQFPVQGLLTEKQSESQAAQVTVQRYSIGRAGKGDRLPVWKLSPANVKQSGVVVLAHPNGKSAFFTPEHGANGLAARLLEQGLSVVLVDTFLTGELANPEISQQRDHLAQFFCTYNRTDLQERVQDLVTVCAWVRQTSSVALCGSGRAGLWALLAAPAADAVAADGEGLDLQQDRLLLERDLFAPGLRRFGDVWGAASLAAPRPLFIHQAGLGLNSDWLEATYQAAKAKPRLKIKAGLAADEIIAKWLAKSVR